MPRKSTLDVPPGLLRQTDEQGDSPEVAEATAATDAALAALTEGAPEGGEEPRPAKVNPALRPVPLDMLGDAEDVPEEEWDAAPLTVPEERDESQVRIDADVKDAYDKWVAAEKPTVSKSPRKRRIVSPEFAPAVRLMIGKAARFHGVSAVLSKPAFNKDGKEIITFSVRDKAPKRERKTADANLQAIRAWAENQGMEVSKRGRIPEDILTAYRKANPEAPEEGGAEGGEMTLEDAAAE
jgi:Lsr2